MIIEVKKLDFSSLTVKDLAGIARSDITRFATVLPNLSREPDKIKRALSNVELISRINSIPSIETFLRVTGAEVGILVHHRIRTRKSLYFDSKGFKLVRRDNGNEEERVNLDEAWLRYMLQRLSRFPADGYFVEEFADLEPEKITDRFKKAFSKPIKVK